MMLSREAIRTGRGLGELAIAFALLVLGAMALQSRTALAQVKPSNVSAKYDIHFNGINIGSFRFRSEMSGGEYSLSAKAEISLLAGVLFNWQGATASVGTLTTRGPRPSTYSFGYATHDKSEQVQLRFNSNTVREVTLNPPQKPSRKRVPVTRAHLQDVIDPLSAVVTLSVSSGKKKGRAVCNNRLPIFDGKQRYDLVLTHKRTKRVKTGNGYKGRAHICNVKFIPIAGHKADKEHEYAAWNNIEVWLIPVPEAELYIPYHISVPTAAGTASMTSTRFEIELPGDSKKALVY